MTSTVTALPSFPFISCIHPLLPKTKRVTIYKYADDEIKDDTINLIEDLAAAVKMRELSFAKGSYSTLASSSANSSSICLPGILDFTKNVTFPRSWPPRPGPNGKPPYLGYYRPRPNQKYNAAYMRRIEEESKRIMKNNERKREEEGKKQRLRRTRMGVMGLGFKGVHLGME
ncbi:hypothetical protein G7K_1309-t1 [Saitoella complicata NRRL Y-17804]|uniref:Uncharacterized protein n=1 Tax=Saitoella complicata (strain BCRC 22490 / CBS 7301 / JCM 7358 / NBRC 10748 / NRRL Y-17804) TaxID=698492 RepID=A0A0E9NB44_SAICN|nr:hypothetical protein G7K_1309-t1 [Saitoella complicata NRRL Y-17804]